ncbi:MAG TPA: hypothetical protein PLP61_14905, partial [Nocardioides sp.]|uniref:2-oxoglutarate dehydrogenase E1 subunit family protein n=1 Tax=Nocardioides sp. TaxID=35761 RepID=UPI002BEAC6DA
MSQTPDQQSTESSTALPAGFGANDWLVDEMFERYTADPSSVAPEWATWFATHGNPAEGNGTPQAAAAPASAAPAAAAS